MHRRQEERFAGGKGQASDRNAFALEDRAQESLREPGVDRDSGAQAGVEVKARRIAIQRQEHLGGIAGALGQYRHVHPMHFHQLRDQRSERLAVHVPEQELGRWQGGIFSGGNRKRNLTRRALPCAVHLPRTAAPQSARDRLKPCIDPSQDSFFCSAPPRRARNLRPRHSRPRELRRSGISAWCWARSARIMAGCSQA
jgi:hypothetical protein